MWNRVWIGNGGTGYIDTDPYPDPVPWETIKHLMTNSKNLLIDLPALKIHHNPSRGWLIIWRVS